MKSFVRFILTLAAISALLAACAVTPRVSTWASSKPFTRAQVFNAALGSGAEVGYTVTASDRESGTISLTRKIGDGNMILNARIVGDNKTVRVQTTANFTGDIAIAGMHEEAIRNFHIMLFRKLNVDVGTELNNVRVEQLR